MRMHSPAHPGRLLKLHMGQMTVKALAEHLGVPRGRISRILKGRFGVTAKMALKLEVALPKTNAEFWLKLQSNYDLAEAVKKQAKTKKKIKPIPTELIVPEQIAA